MGINNKNRLWSKSNEAPEQSGAHGTKDKNQETLRTDWGSALQRPNMKKSGPGALGSKDENQKTMNNGTM